MTPRPLLLIASLLTSGCLSTACSDGLHRGKPSPEQLKQQLLSGLVYVEGGQFQMGDVGRLDPHNHGLNYTIDQTAQPIHTVELSPFYIQKYRVTNQDYEQYLTITGKTEPTAIQKAEQDEIKPPKHWPDEMASVTWYEARDYCVWAGQQIGKVGDLPTEAQWEYAARSRGQIVPFATDNGTLTPGRNIPTREQLHEMHPDRMMAMTIRIGHFPPNPLGLYDLSYGGLEWLKDWYAADYYQHSPLKDPQGPESGAEKSARGIDISDSGIFGSLTQPIYIRYYVNPALYSDYLKRNASPYGIGMRCAFK